MKHLLYKLSFIAWYVCSLLPFRLFYCISDAMYYILFYAIRYRRKVIYNNLTASFPEKTPAEIDQIARKFYAFFCDYMVETIKYFSISEQNIRRRIRFEGIEAARQDIQKGQSVSLFLGHYCNWEWVSSLGIHFDCQCGQIYHPLENPYFDKLFLHMRSRFKVQSIAKDDTFLVIGGWEKKGIHSVVGYIADQAPGYASTHYWTNFLNHDTPVFTGAERIAKILNTTAYYIDIERPKRGYYLCRFVKITDSIDKQPIFYVTEQYFRLLEKSIQRAPQYWLWSHNRWKRTREEFNRLYSEEERKKRLSRL